MPSRNGPDSQEGKAGRKTAPAVGCCDATYMHVHCVRCGKPSPDALLCVKCFYGGARPGMAYPFVNPFGGGKA